jgi:hypothetical protein
MKIFSSPECSQREKCNMNGESTEFTNLANALEQLAKTGQALGLDLQQTGTVAQLVLQKMNTHGWQIGGVETLRIVDAVLTGK